MSGTKIRSRAARAALVLLLVTAALLALLSTPASAARGYDGRVCACDESMATSPIATPDLAKLAHCPILTLPDSTRLLSSFAYSYASNPLRPGHAADAIDFDNLTHLDEDRCWAPG